jgi:hypothetical protein
MIESRINNPSSINDRQVRAILEAGRSPTIQFSQSMYTPSLLRRLNDLCAEFGERLEVRFYGHHNEVFDAETLTRLPDVKWLSVDCLTTIRNEAEIGRLPCLEQLSFGVFDFDRPHFLRSLPLSNLRRLVISETAKRNFDLAPLAQAHGLRVLFLNGHTRNIEAVEGLPLLSELTLSAMPKTRSLGFLSQVPALRSLTLILGGRVSLDDFCHPLLEELNVIRVRGLASMGNLARFAYLRRLSIEDQLQLRAIDVAGTELRGLSLFNCKNLARIEGLDQLGQLEVFRTGGTDLDLDALRDRPWPPSLKVVGLYKSSRIWNESTRRHLDGLGYREFSEWGA